MATHAPTQNATHNAPLFSLPTTTRNRPGIPRWQELDPHLQQTLIDLLTQIISNHLPRSSTRDERGGADDSC
jgi:hypothetical protein